MRARITARALDHENRHSILAGGALITPLGGTTLTLTANTMVSDSGTQTTGIRAGPIQTITSAQADQLMQQFTVRSPVTSAAGQQQTGEVQLQMATQLVNTVMGTLGREARLTAIATPTTTPEASVVIVAPLCRQ